jgi:hypothetical protein
MQELRATGCESLRAIAAMEEAAFLRPRWKVTAAGARVCPRDHGRDVRQGTGDHRRDLQVGRWSGGDPGRYQLQAFGQGSLLPAVLGVPSPTSLNPV